MPISTLQRLLPVTGNFLSDNPQTKKRLLLAAVVVAVVLFCFFNFYLPTTKQLELSGLVQASEAKNASRFGGRVMKVMVKEGDWVAAGQELVLFDDVDLRAKIADARAALTEAKARQSLMMAGADNGDLKQAYARVQQADENFSLLRQGARSDQLAQFQAGLTTAQGKLESAKTAALSADKMLSEGVISQRKYDEIQANYSAAQSNYESADAALKTARRGARPEELRTAKSQQMAARAQYQQLARGAKREELAIVAAAVAQAQSALEALEAQLDEVTLKAPMKGLVSVVSVSPGELVQPGRPVITIIDPNDLWTDLYVPESRLSGVHVGQAVKIKPLMMKNTLLDGKVATISPKSEFVPGSDGANTGEEASFKVKVVVTNPTLNKDQPLRSGMNVHVLFNKP